MTDLQTNAVGRVLLLKTKGGIAMRSKKIITVKDYIAKYNKCFMKFGDLVARKLSDETLIEALAEKDLEKLAKVWRLVFGMISENSEDDAGDEMAALIGEYHGLDGEDDE